ncbi:hypothetical protein [Cohnella pontilimi]|uniref:hypothetical protein n=1 Tax=Cohnella pontilimi TaxID=2564100 RepID=UPI00145C63D1|nr:hypothetical protein [Cohnella pontilimi]
MADKVSKEMKAKGEVQTTDLNVMPAPELDPSATEQVYGSHTNLAEHSLLNKKEQS